MALDLPQQTFDEAVSGAAAWQKEGHDNYVAETLKAESTLDLSKSTFLQFIFNR